MKRVAALVLIVLVVCIVAIPSNSPPRTFADNTITVCGSQWDPEIETVVHTCVEQKVVKKLWTVPVSARQTGLPACQSIWDEYLQAIVYICEPVQR